MKRAVPWLTLLFQMFMTGCVLIVIYFIHVLLDATDFGFDYLVGFILFQPIIAFVLVSTTITICLVVGLPIRIMRAVNQWWIRKPAISTIGVAVGFMLLILAFHPSLQEITSNYQIPISPT